YNKDKRKLLEFIAVVDGVGALLCFAVTFSKGMCILCCRLVERSKLGVWSRTTSLTMMTRQLMMKPFLFRDPRMSSFSIMAVKWSLPQIRSTSNQKNYQSVDAINKPDILFHVTGAHKHRCEQRGLYDVLKLLGNPTEPRLYFVLPPDRFTDFKYQG
ncbi:TPA: hypothetical protein N0F65_004139, partial [Lagenidium giganteum]